ncbi:dTDP-rhamnosyl transferase RfbF [Mycoavidus cysteinexigens]|uniref:dTDP-rhamnosyl transferase RfbF n=1 Tax=Mycoavidus cysteinexigens TaxID=1553431 RepID=A0A2Z6EXU0_9BURK|nr:glycosyltransferase family 2 protein [Mycoavidus cysteinexigens]BBE10261.1 dTDP-rhamnosyl transferase RfbF [Mycoavidus cysteinexigens]GLR00678.1 dTDP-rhamnosyl transferase RfbF [Mycoavidus cysteinexigens]
MTKIWNHEAAQDGLSGGIVVVFYRPDVECVRRANALAKMALCVVIDNTEQVSRASDLGLDNEIVYVANGANRGIAAAINQGVEVLIDAGCKSALIFDQDSEASSQLVRDLPCLLEEQLNQGKPVALIGPAYEDARFGSVTPFVRFGYWKLRRIAPVGTQPIEVDFLISSGSCINLAAWRDIGPMDEGLFIDFVDLEWCVRARAKGYSALGAPMLRLAHELGGEPVRVLGRVYPSHSPLRHYYLFRNAVALIKRGYVPWSWKSTELVKLPVRLMIYSLFMRPRLDHLRMSLIGLWHGLTGRMGPLH